jgi:hypothetical protein
MEELVNFIKNNYPDLQGKLEIWTEDKSASLCLDPIGESRRTGRMQWGLQIQSVSSKILFNVAYTGDLITFDFATYRMTLNKTYDDPSFEEREFIFDMDTFSTQACSIIDNALESEKGRAKFLSNLKVK